MMTSSDEETPSHQAQPPSSTGQPTPQTLTPPSTVDEDPGCPDEHISRSHDADSEKLCCLLENCPGGPFEKREALDCHYQTSHFLHCDREHCRRTAPFKLRSDLRRHLRRTHRETIAEDYRGQIEDFPGKFRCYTCLFRVPINNCGEECVSCKTPWEAEKRETRGVRRPWDGGPWHQQRTAMPGTFGWRGEWLW
ncbi:hypothetical protein PCL_01576 [Purpureocillium lilacinum]|uniref:C2H2-type domain-containing protein n=1 Tax=Purpureocillium lilacinum TaxID=33203 RepID=A0A2U3DNY7_PURLI|nr:hypothetical protein PCL_01576 [Purpureocillium lilacinum]